MSDDTQLRLVDPVQHDGDPILLERRDTTRRRIAQHVTVVVSTKSPDGLGKRISSLRLRDMSHTGIGASCSDRLQRDAKLTLLFPPHGAERGFDVTGQVVRCERAEDGYEVGIRVLDRPSMNVA